ncbi:M23 family metallopeptidase [Glutamicibacter protophormiae]|uniref:M23 family metallopeptidase n=2 Tax=Glutamicibacter protophormiae TaxID=37930 RepID=UPI00332EA79B
MSCGLWLIVVAVFLRIFPGLAEPLGNVRPLISLAGLIFLVPAVILAKWGRSKVASCANVCAPLVGSWTAVSSPATRVPSHGTHQFGQTWAIDLVKTPSGNDGPKFTILGGMARPEEFESFGEQVYAASSGTVVYEYGKYRDHRCRNSWIALPYLVVESFIRGLLGSGLIFGNLVVIQMDSGGYQAFAHLKKSSICVTTGQRVVVGDKIAEVGNSGNSSEPHLHFQLMSRRKPAFSVGLPLAFKGGEIPKRGERVSWNRIAIGDESD